jgi:hypothetical protein
MPDLSEILGAFLGSVAHARRLADQETVAIAQHYRSDPLLQGLSVPRVRLPEVVLELPVLVEGFRAASKPVPPRRRRGGVVGCEPAGRPAGLEVTVVTDAIKERTNPASVTRLRLTLKEEGLEWTVTDRADGSARSVLTPE